MIELRSFLAGLATDVDSLGKFVTDPEHAMASADLTADDRSALLSGDQGAVYGRLLGDDVAVAPSPIVVIISDPPLSPSGDVTAGLAYETEPSTAYMAFGARRLEATAPDEEGGVDDVPDVAEAIIDEGGQTAGGDSPSLLEGIPSGDAVLQDSTGLAEYVPEDSGLADPDPEGPAPEEETTEGDEGLPPM